VPCAGAGTWSLVAAGRDCVAAPLAGDGGPGRTHGAAPAPTRDGEARGETPAVFPARAAEPREAATTVPPSATRTEPSAAGSSVTRERRVGLATRARRATARGPSRPTGWPPAADALAPHG